MTHFNFPECLIPADYTGTDFRDARKLKRLSSESQSDRTAIHAQVNIPGFEIQRQIGRGGMASVYLAIQKSLDRPVALKVLTNPKAPGFSERFLREGRIIASLNHTHIITIHDIDIADGLPYLSMEYVTGGDLKDRIGDGLPPDTALKIVEKIGGALKAAHDKGIVHRDVKPTNILFRDDDTPLLTDFGIAKQSRAENELTATGDLLGTPYYLSPEQAKNAPLDGRTDIYSLGIVLYEMLTGKKPYEGDSDITTIFKHFYDPLPTLSTRLQRIQPLLERMVAKDREHRFSDTDEMLRFVQDVRAKILEHRQQAPTHREGTTVREIRSGDESSAVARHFWLTGMDKLSLTAIGSVLLILAIVAVYSSVKQEQQIVQIQSSASSSTYDLEIDNVIAHDVDSLQAASKNAPDSQPAADAASAVSIPPALPDESEDRKNKRASLETQVLSPQQNTVSGSRSETGGSASVDDDGNQHSDSYAADIVDLSPGLNNAVPAEIRQEASALVALGDKRLQQNKLTLPPGNNALHYYKQALNLEPGNADAQYGLTKIATRFGELAEQQISRGNFTSAERYIAAGLDIAPWDSRLKALNRRIKIERVSRRAIGEIKGVLRSIKKEIKNN